MKKIQKIDLSGVEHLDESAAKKYVAESNSSECINLEAVSTCGADNSGNSGSSGGSGGSGNSGGSGGSGTSTNPRISPECSGLHEGSTCTINGKEGKCAYRKVTEGFIFKENKVVLACVLQDGSGVGVELSARERACIGKRYGDACSYVGDYGVDQYGHCYYSRYSGITGILRCAKADY